MLPFLFAKVKLKSNFKANNLTFLTEIAIQDFIFLQNTYLISPLFCEFLCGIMFEAAVRRLYT